jgi:hypothetical protein
VIVAAGRPNAFIALSLPTQKLAEDLLPDAAYAYLSNCGDQRLSPGRRHVAFPRTCEGRHEELRKHA